MQFPQLISINSSVFPQTTFYLVIDTRIQNKKYYIAWEL